MSKIALDKNKINPEHIDFLKEQFNEKTTSGALYRLIEFYCLKYENDKQTFAETKQELIDYKNKFNQLKTYVKARQTAETNILKIIHN